MRVFVDTSAFLALMNADDAFHIEASSIFTKLLSSGNHLVSTNYILVETIAVLQSRYGMEPVYDFIDKILPILQIVWVSQAEHQMAVQLLRATNRRRVSLVDCVSIVIMNQLGIDRVFAADRDFEHFGFVLLKATE